MYKRQVEQILRMLLANDEGGLVLLKQEFGARINYIVKSILTNEEDAAECINDIYSVSYTHLDVYKRQVWRFPL